MILWVVGLSSVWGLALSSGVGLRASLSSPHPDPMCVHACILSLWNQSIFFFLSLKEFPRHSNLKIFVLKEKDYTNSFFWLIKPAIVLRIPMNYFMKYVLAENNWLAFWFICCRWGVFFFFNSSFTLHSVFLHLTYCKSSGGTGATNMENISKWKSSSELNTPRDLKRETRTKEVEHKEVIMWKKKGKPCLLGVERQKRKDLELYFLREAYATDPCYKRK